MWPMVFAGLSNLCIHVGKDGVQISQPREVVAPLHDQCFQPRSNQIPRCSKEYVVKEIIRNSFCFEPFHCQPRCQTTSIQIQIPIMMNGCQMPGFVVAKIFVVHWLCCIFALLC